MHAKQMAEVAGWLSVCSELFHTGLLPPRHQDGLSYWVASKCRLQRWQSALKVFERDLDDPQEQHDPWHAIEILIEEVLISDVLTRVWTALLVHEDAARGHVEMQSIGHSVYIGHLEIRNRCLRLLLHNRAANEDAFHRLDGLRIRMERWTDLLLSRLVSIAIARQFGFDAERIDNFAADRHLEDRARRRQMESLLQSSFSAALIQDGSSCSANPDLNRDIVAGVLECLPADRFDDLGLPKGLMQLQLEQVPDELHRALQELEE